MNLERILLGPGPSTVPPEVLQAMAQPTIGHLDPRFIEIMTETQDRLRQVFATKNQLTIPISATGSAGMECLFVNALEPGDRVLIGINGVFGGRMAEIARRIGAEVLAIEKPFGQAIDPAEVQKELQKGPVKMVAIVHAETSTGIHQPIDDIAKLCQEHDALLLLDAVTSLGGTPVKMDEWKADLIYSGTQKCLSCPPGLSPISVSEKAADVIRKRKTPCPSWYLDLSLLMNYWGEGERAYHHTAPINMIYGLHQALGLVLQEGLENRFKRHQINHQALMAGIEALGLGSPIEPLYRLPQLNVIEVPGGVDEKSIRMQLLQRFGIEIGAGLGAFKGKVWRIGLMGHASSPKSVLAVLSGLKACLGDSAGNGDPLAAASAIYATQGWEQAEFS